jgi:hypothetical protein
MCAEMQVQQCMMKNNDTTFCQNNARSWQVSIMRIFSSHSRAIFEEFLFSAF